MEVPAPVPLLVPGMYVDLPEPKWRVKQTLVLRELAQQMSVVRLCDIPFPPQSRLVYQSWQPSSLSELQSYAQHVLESPSLPPLCSTRIYPDSIYVAHSLKQDSLLRFDSHFESGNLSRAYALSDSEYDLYITPDTNTCGHTQWFYFSVTRMKAGMTVRFNIVNLTKGNSLLAKGLRPVFHSLANGAGWVKVTGELQFFRNCYQRVAWRHSAAVDQAQDEDTTTGWYYTLTFYHTFTHTNDTVSFAFSEPYTLSRLQECLVKLERDVLSCPKFSFKKEILCESTLGLDLPIITITSTNGSGKSGRRKQAIIFTARVHPGETPSSFLIEELMKFLVSHTETAKNLLAMYVFYFVPMLNPDGVLLGNYRSCIEGVDLNRRWKTDVYQPIRSLKGYIQNVISERKVAMFCDLHAHGKKNDAFIYGCNTASNGGFTSWTKVRLFPRILAKLSHFFNYESCKFKVQKDKLGTGRVVLWKDFNVTNSFTLETSFHAYHRGTDLVEFASTDYSTFSSHIMESLLRYSDLLEQFEQEIALNGGWLKPGKLKEMTGIPAQQLAVLEQEELNRRERYKQARLSNTYVTPVSGGKSARSTSAQHKRTQKSMEETEQVIAVGNGRRLRIRPKAEPSGGWRDYFSLEEVQTVLKQLKDGKDFEESESSGSDSEPSDGNFSDNCEESSESEETPSHWGERNKEEEEKTPKNATFTAENSPSPALPEPEEEYPLPTRSQIIEKVSVSPLPMMGNRKSGLPPQPMRQSPTPKLSATTGPMPNTSALFHSSAYPVSDIHKILRETHRSNASFDYADVSRPRIHRERNAQKRSTSPIILIESYSARKPPARDIRPTEAKTLSSAQRLGVSTHTARSVYSSKPVLAATTRFGTNARVTRREFQFDALKRPKVQSRPKKLDPSGLIIG